MTRPAPAELAPQLVQCVTKVATLVEAEVPKILAAQPVHAKVSGPAAGSATIKQVRKAAGKLLAAPSVASPPHPMHQPHLEVAVQPLGVEKAK